ncbi:MAG TPA: FliI/YscN family ATPase [Defluviitoga tunisiensis]|jgi:flagellum-specific ATP synthase|uniref:Flagellum-specific ATP synthase n=1 Tax=Defluviitoga tunisiensis TaxID=1006576 RepID=A0A0C7P052_DEFTU|nr:FliI/YscN family ATPase [Defluviitoga tunisiensis]MDY0380082.1 FliI/YscN family ATPase [Defluviitoga tunisiensis]CEP78918.1 Flagellum-specific ATP synthase [Defluviitoga tunisiensis]HOB55407.1 FliI/YscN family ATPase [Defluviitoga tunisiensis]HOK16033.1 FliI/YscN family ATPase [Defluviitoga tunisiensis]HOP34370.1 FliI/YscN family ATPase [Defluviitoga tunisiensis]
MKKVTFENSLKSFEKKIESRPLFAQLGKVSRIIGVTIESTGPNSAIGDLCKIKLRDGTTVLAETVGFSDNKVLLMPLEDVGGLYVGAPVEKVEDKITIKVGTDLLGHVLDGIGRPIDGNKIKHYENKSIYSSAPNPLVRKRIKEPLSVGVRAIDGFLTLGKGQRIGIMAGSGVGKSTLLGMIARNTSADINVIGLIGERGREVREFIEKDLGEEGLKRSILVVSTSDSPALLRVKALYTATTIAEYFRDLGYDVLMMVDSITRWAMAQREIGLSIGEPPTTRGYTPSVFANMPKILERAGNSVDGSMTAIYTVLVEADDMNDPIGDSVRSIVDGHIVLSRKLADSSHYPPIDILASVSRLMTEVADKEHLEASKFIKDIYASYIDSKDLIEVGAYKKGSNPKVDVALAEIENINNFLRQDIYEKTDYKETLAMLIDIQNRCKKMVDQN